ncbi:MAG: hypothetical protein HKO56_05670, partial [Bacteroidia bacterium]|nr:hypothetical protein [Bacteroidia bacterium]
ITLLSNNFCNAQNQINASVSTVAADDKPITDFYGFNGQNIISGNVTLDDPDFLKKLCDLYPATLRFPGGTIAMYWDWKTGQFLENDISSNSCLWSKERYDNSNFTPNTLLRLKSFVDKTGAAPIFDLNTVTSDKYYQLAQLYEAASLNIPIKYVEFGNELYSEKLCAFPYVYPTPTDYANEMLLWNDVFKGNTGSNGHFPYLETAVVGSIHRTIYDPNKEPFREFNWNNEVLPIIGSGPSTIDAVTYHPYFGGGIGSDNNPKAIYNVQNPTRSFLIPNTALLGDVGSLLNEEAGSELNQYGLNGWLTEYNMFDDHNTILGSWAHAMAVSFHSLLFLEKSNSLNGAPNNIDHVNLHTMLGGSRWGAIFSNDNGLEFNEDEQFNGPITCNNNSNINLPSTEALEYTAVGQSMKLLTKASKNATRANRINFSNAPILSYSSWIPIDGVHGWLFEDSNQPTPVSQAILLNLTENPLTVNLNSTELSDMNTMESLSSEFYYYFTGENTSDCYNPIGYVYPTNTDCSCTYNKSTTAISNTITLAPFSINRLFKNDLNNCNNLIKLKANNDNICDGSSVGLQAYLLPLSDDVNNPTWTYNWSSSQSISLPSNTNSSSVVISPTHSGTGASTLVTYTVTISGTGCSTAPSATIDIFVHEKPTLNLTSSASPGNFSCQGEAITLEAEVLGSDQANFVWITDKAYGISAETITDKSSITVSPEETTEYIVYAVNNNRVCYLSNSITIPVLKLEEEVTICRGTDRLIDISNFINDANINLNNYDINWYIDNALQIGFTDQTSFLFTAPLNTSTINSIQVIIDNTTNPDCIVGETQITTVDCCRIPDLNAPDKNEITDGSTLTEFIEHYNSNMPANAIDLNNNTISIIGTGGGNQNDLATIYVFGKFFIDRNVDFKAVNFNMAEGSEVIVLPGANLNATERSTGQTPTVFEACSNYMWKGIRLMQNSQLIFRENTTSLINDFDVEVKDAEYGIYIENSEAPNFKSTPVSLSKVGLINNLNSIFIEPKDENATFNSHVSLVLKGCEVDGAQLKQAYIGQNTTVGAKANAAIVAYDANLAINNTTAAENIFKNLSNGIIANKCNLYLENNKFENITTDVTYNNKFNGTAIYASDIDYNGIRPAGFYSIEQKGFGKFSGNFTFTDCDVSIVTERMNVNISETEHDNVEKGIIVRHCTNRDVLIEKNTINSAKEGIELWNNDFANSISVQENDINFGYFPFPVISGTEPPLVSGIQVYETLNYNEDAKIHANNIQFLGLNSSARRFGINMLGTHNYEVSENFVFMTNNLTDEVGIRVYGCYNTNVSCNDVFGASNYNTNMRNSAITAFGLGYPLTVSCNDVNNTYDGILFHGPSNSSSTFSSVAGNIFRNHFNALHLTSSAVIGKQERTGNLW